MREFLRPEFLARVDDIIVFRNLNKEDFKGIARLVLNEYVDSLSEKGIKFEFDDLSVDFIAEKSTGGKSGARDIRNYIRHNVEDKIASEIISHGEGMLTTAALTVENDDLIIETW